MSDRKIFTVEEARALVPRLSRLVEAQLLRASDIERRWKLIRDAKKQGADAAREEEELHQEVDRYEQGWRDIEALGVVVKDPRLGLLDFYGRLSGKLVWLCWRYGERSVDHYHALDEGFAGRKPITGHAKAQLLN